MFNVNLESVGGHVFNDVLSYCSKCPPNHTVYSLLSFKKSPVQIRQSVVSSRSRDLVRAWASSAQLSRRGHTPKTAPNLIPSKGSCTKTEVLNRAMRQPISPSDTLLLEWRFLFRDNDLLSGWKMSLQSVMTSLLQTKTLIEDCRRRKRRVPLSELKNQQLLKKLRLWNSKIEVPERNEEFRKDVEEYHLFPAKDNWMKDFNVLSNLSLKRNGIAFKVLNEILNFYAHGTSKLCPFPVPEKKRWTRLVRIVDNYGFPVF